MHRERVGGQQGERVLVESLKPSSEQLVRDMAEDGRRDFEKTRKGKDRYKTCLDGFYYSRGFCGRKAVDCPRLTEQKLTAAEFLDKQA